MVHAHDNTHVVDVSPTLLYVAKGVKNVSYEKDNAHRETQGIRSNLMSVLDSCCTPRAGAKIK